MYSVTVQTYFWAGHSVLMPDGSLEPRHSHNFAVTAKVSAEKLNPSKMVVDFLDLKKPLDAAAESLSGRALGQIEYFQTNGQSTEIIAKYFYEILERSLTDDVTLDYVTVRESPGCAASFSK
jgi:6-pyruvoyl-tetrahydropterin synthase